MCHFTKSVPQQLHLPPVFGFFFCLWPRTCTLRGPLQEQVTWDTDWSRNLTGQGWPYLLVYLLPISSFDADTVPQQSGNYPMVKRVLKHSQKLELLRPTYLINTSGEAKGEGLFPAYLSLYKIGAGYETCHPSALRCAGLCLPVASLPKPSPDLTCRASQHAAGYGPAMTWTSNSRGRGGSALLNTLLHLLTRPNLITTQLWQTTTGLVKGKGVITTAVNIHSCWVEMLR